MNNDLISRSALLEEFEWLKMTVGVGSVNDIDDAIERIKKAQTVDAVEVIRCKDCKKYMPEPMGDVMMCYRCGDWPGPDDYCGRAVRKDAEIEVEG